MYFSKTNPYFRQDLEGRGSGDPEKQTLTVICNKTVFHEKKKQSRLRASQFSSNGCSSVRVGALLLCTVTNEGEVLHFPAFDSA